MPLGRGSVAGGGGLVSRAVYTHCDEGEIAELLERLTAEHPGVTIGSYPVWEGQGYSLKLTFDGRESEAVAAAAEALIVALPPEAVLRDPPKELA